MKNQARDVRIKHHVPAFVPYLELCEDPEIKKEPLGVKERHYLTKMLARVPRHTTHLRHDLENALLFVASEIYTFEERILRQPCVLATIKDDNVVTSESMHVVMVRYIEHTKKCEACANIALAVKGLYHDQQTLWQTADMYPKLAEKLIAMMYCKFDYIVRSVLFKDDEKRQQHKLDALYIPDKNYRIVTTSSEATAFEATDTEDSDPCPDVEKDDSASDSSDSERPLHQTIYISPFDDKASTESESDGGDADVSE